MFKFCPILILAALISFYIWNLTAMEDESQDLSELQMITNFKQTILEYSASDEHIFQNDVEIAKEGDDKEEERSAVIIAPITPRKKKLMFFKTHKCGTSSLVNSLYLYGIRRNLNFVLTPYEHQLFINKPPLKLKPGL